MLGQNAFQASQENQSVTFHILLNIASAQSEDTFYYIKNTLYIFNFVCGLKSVQKLNTLLTNTNKRQHRQSQRSPRPIIQNLYIVVHVGDGDTRLYR